jgi:HK97 gp10 family phage protein
MQNAKWHGDRFKQSCKKGGGDLIEWCAFFVEREAKRFCAVRFGILRASTHTKFKNNKTVAWIGTDSESLKAAAAGKLAEYKTTGRTKRRKILTAITTGTIVFYGPFLEYGTRNMKARPFLRPALDALKGKLRRSGARI